MIKLIDALPEISECKIELIRIKCTFLSYSDTALFWMQDDCRAMICMLDGDMTVYNRNADLEELREFISVLNPTSVFSDSVTLIALFGVDFEAVQVLGAQCIGKPAPCDTVNSREMYDLLNVSGLELPPYPFFAVDYCHRINHGLADFFAIKGKCAAITFSADKHCILNGIASHKKGMGSVALAAIMYKNRGKYMLCSCRDDVKGFYIKNGFAPLYQAGYWRRKA